MVTSLPPLYLVYVGQLPVAGGDGNPCTGPSQEQVVRSTGARQVAKWQSARLNKTEKNTYANDTITITIPDFRKSRCARVIGHAGRY